MAPATRLSKSNPRKVIVKIRNPRPGGQTHVHLERARRLIGHGKAYFDAVGQLVFTGQHVGRTRGDLDVIDARDARPDAFPRRAVLPPSGEVLRRMHSSGGRYLSPAEVMRARHERNLAARVAGAGY